jgi:pimeloyl-ACP methyl ester carboxylesterase
MRKCLQCGNEFGVIRHVFRRGEFCSKKCFDNYGRDDSWRRAWESKTRVDGTDDPENAVTIVGKAVQQPSTTVVRWQEGDRQPPLYFIGGELPEFRLAQLMGPGRAIFGVRLRWPLAWREAATRNDPSALPKIEQIAAFYAEALRTQTHLSPCMLAGYSFEGIIAFETARQFQAMGGTVQMVILLDSRTKYPPPAPHVVAWPQLRKYWGLEQEGKDGRDSILSIGTGLLSSWPVFWWMLKKTFKGIGRRFQQAVLRDPGMLSDKTDEKGVHLRWGLIERLFVNAMNSYFPQRLDCRGFLFRVDSEDDTPVHGLGDALGWENLFGKGLEIIEIPGDHVTLMRAGPSNAILAKKMNDLLARSATKTTLVG